MSSLAVYFGPKIISIVDCAGIKPLNNIQIALPEPSTEGALEEKVPDEMKLSTLIKEALIKHKIEAKTIAVGLSGKDLIIRTFEMPALSRQEVSGAASFEVKKYIPFKLEELTFDIQWIQDKAIQKTRVLFVGIKKDALDKYIAVTSKLGLKPQAIEYSAFSLLRLLRLTHCKESGIIAVVNIDVLRNDEANFVVLEDGFPLFSRDITFLRGGEEAEENTEVPSSGILEKLKRELQISLDYYDRKFPSKNIKTVHFIMDKDYSGRADLLDFVMDLGLGSRFIDISRYFQGQEFSLPSVKAYSGSLVNIRTSVKIDLLEAKARSVKKVGKEQYDKVAETAQFKFKQTVKLAVSGLLLCVLVFFFGVYRSMPIKGEIKNIVNIRPSVLTVSAGLSSEEMEKIQQRYQGKIEALDKVIKQRLYFTSILDAIPRVISKGIWLTEVNFFRERNASGLTLRGIVSLGDTTKEMDAINTFVAKMKEDATFRKSFKDINIVSIDHEQGRESKGTNTNFVITASQSQ
ncbi:MAG: pilus assembly protein PilM [Candidatus Omnitrophota bacterium]